MWKNICTQSSACKKNSLDVKIHCRATLISHENATIIISTH